MTRNMKTFEPCERREDGCIDAHLLGNHTELTESGYWEITPLMAECLDKCDKFESPLLSAPIGKDHTYWKQRPGFGQLLPRRQTLQL